MEDDHHEDYPLDEEEEWDHEKWMMRRANYAYFGVALGEMIRLGIEHFRYRKVDNYYKAGEVDGGINWWKLGNTVYGYGSFALWSIATVTQFIALFGTGLTANLWAWYTVQAFGGLLATFYGVCAWLAYEDGYKVRRNESSTMQEKRDARDLQDQIKIESNTNAIYDFSTFITLAVYYEDWLWYHEIPCEELSDDPESYEQCLEKSYKKRPRRFRNDMDDMREEEMHEGEHSDDHEEGHSDDWDEEDEDFLANDDAIVDEPVDPTEGEWTIDDVTPDQPAVLAV